MSTEHGQFDPLLDPVSSPDIEHFYRLRKVEKTYASLAYRVLVLCLFAALAGCQGIFLPRIDPNGSRVFLPFPSTTAVQVPRLHSTPTQPGILPNSAFPEPAAPPPCIDADGEGGICNMFKNKLVGHIAKKHSPGSCGELQLTPMKVVAPVGGEVVLLAGICGKDGYLVKREPLEWMLSPDSVGTFIEVGDDARSQVIRALRHDPKVEKLDVDFARGRTSNRETLITRGTPGKEDDIKLLEGQTWLSISSPSEGVSRVTALAPDSDIWDQRRQTATIYWVDAQWEFPQPQSVNSGGAATLVTRVTKAENLKPATGWDVVYTIVDPTVAQFAPPADMGSGRVQISGNAAIVKVDADSKATIQLTAPPGGRGTTAVVIEVYRPAEPSDNLPRLLLARGQTFVTFSSPSLVINAQGPPTGVTGEPLVYNVSLANAGNLDAENVVLDFFIPAGMALVQAPSLQPERTTPDTLRWDQGTLAAKRQIDITLVLAAQQPGDYELRFGAQGTSSAVQGAPPLTAQTSVGTRVVQPTVNIRFQPANGVAQAEAGGRIDYEIEVTNTGRQAITDTQLAIETSPGLVHLETGNTKVDQNLGMIQPGETRKLGISFLVQQEGQHTAAIRVKSGEAIIGEQKSAILGIPAPQKVPGIAVAISFPESVTVGNTARAEITLRNTGQTTLTALRVAINSDPALRPKRVNSENLPRVRFDGQSLVWSPQDLMKGTSGDSIIQIFVDYEAIAPATQANIVAQATCTQQVQDEARAVTRIVGGNVPPSNTGPQVPRSGQLDISLVDFNDPTTVRTPIRYGLRITNGQNQPDRNIRIQLKIPQGLELQSITETLTGKQINFRRDGDILEFVETIKFLRDTDSVDYTVIIVGLVPNVYEIGAAVASDGQPNWKTTSQSTTINARP